MFRRAVTRAHVQRLRFEAVAAGHDPLTRLCERALAGDREARALAREAVISRARAAIVADSYVYPAAPTRKAALRRLRRAR